MEMRPTPKGKETVDSLSPSYSCAETLFKTAELQVYLSEYRSAEIPQLCLPFLFSSKSSLARSDIPSKILPLLPLPGRKDKHLHEG